MTEEAQPKKEKLSRLKSFLTCPLFSKKKADELREVHSESEKINARIESLVSSVEKLAKAQKKSIKELTKKNETLSKKIQSDAKDRKIEINDSLDELKTVVASQTDRVELFQKTASSKVNEAIETVTGVKGDIAGIQTHLMKSHETLQRFQAGYDYQILKNFVKPLARTISDLDKLLEKLSGDEKKDVMNVREDLLELLEDNSVEQIDPAAGSSRDGKEKETKVLQERVKIDDSEKRNLIASVERVGYRYEFNDGQEKIIQAAQVKLYE